MASLPNHLLSVPTDSQIVTTRIFDHPKELVYKAWTDPVHLKVWWGPEGFTNTFHEHDLRVGGKWVFTMHGPEKGNYANEVVFIKVDPPNLVAWNRISNPVFQVVAMFDEYPGNKTKLTFAMIFNSVEECNKIKSFALDKNEENMVRLEAELNRMKS